MLVDAPAAAAAENTPVLPASHQRQYINETLRDVWTGMDRACQRLRLLKREDVDPQELYLLHSSAVAVIKAVNAFYGRRVVGLPCLTVAGDLVTYPHSVRTEPIRAA